MQILRLRVLLWSLDSCRQRPNFRLLLFGWQVGGTAAFPEDFLPQVGCLLEQIRDGSLGRCWGFSLLHMEQLLGQLLLVRLVFGGRLRRRDLEGRLDHDRRQRNRAGCHGRLTFIVGQFVAPNGCHGQSAGRLRLDATVTAGAARVHAEVDWLFVLHGKGYGSGYGPMMNDRHERDGSPSR